MILVVVEEEKESRAGELRVRTPHGETRVPVREPASSDTVQDRANAAVYNAVDVVDHYPVRGLDVAESVALLKYQHALLGKDVLDIGVGTGRTTRILGRMARRYVGIDYSAPMVRYMHRNHPESEVRFADMRDLSRWHDGSFDFAFASNNVIDAVSHADRLQVFREIRRVLRPDGILVFSSHNRSASSAAGSLRPTLQRSRNPLAQWSYWREYRRQNGNYRRLEPHFSTSDEYMLRADTGHDFSCLHYYIDPAAQTKQLEQLGFSVLDIIDRAGAHLAAGDRGEDDIILMYVARRVEPDYLRT